VEKVENFEDITNRITDPNFLNSRTLLVSENVQVPPDGYVPASTVNISRIANGLAITGQSEGKSALVLPFEYSKCYVITDNSSTGKTEIFRANLMWFGIVFTKKLDIRIEMKFGLLPSFHCREDDIGDLVNLGVTQSSLLDLILKKGGSSDSISGTG